MMVKFATYFLLTLFGGGVVFHLVIISGLLPYDFVWGGRLQSHEDMVKFESFSIVSNAIFLLVVLVKSGVLKWRINPRIISVMLWVMAGLFALNTLGNLISLSLMETIIFTPLTLFSAIFCGVLAYKK